jgi:hypothetical protein
MIEMEEQEKDDPVVNEKTYTKFDFCSYCPYCKLSDVYYDHDCEEEEQDLFCTALNKKVHEGFNWHEIAARHTRSDGKIEGYDFVPDNCPMKDKASPPVSDKPVFHPHAGEFDYLLLYDPHNNLISQVRTEEELLDFLLQVKELKAEGYFIMDHGVKKEISKYGKVQSPIESFVSNALEKLVLS